MNNSKFDVVKPLIGQIGTGWIGRNYAEDFEERGFEVVRYDLDKNIHNKEKIKECDIVFIAVPTPSTPQGFDYSIVEEVLSLVGKDKIAVIKSTVLPGTTNKLQEKFPDIHLMHSPEFLTEKTAKFDVKNPCRNIIGYTTRSQARCQEVMNILPVASYEKIVKSKEAELIKYAGNIWFYWKVVYINMLFDMSNGLGIDYDVVKDAMSADKRIGRTHLEAEHQGGRGAGGHCFIKDMAAFSQLYDSLFYNKDKTGIELLDLLQKKNNELLSQSYKDLDLLKNVYEDELVG